MLFDNLIYSNKNCDISPLSRRSEDLNLIFLSLGCATVQGEHFRHPDPEGFPVFGRQQRPRHQRSRESENVGRASQRRRTIEKRKGSGLEGEGTVCSVDSRNRIGHACKFSRNRIGDACKFSRIVLHDSSQP